MQLATYYSQTADRMLGCRTPTEGEADRKVELLLLARSLYSLRRRRERAFSPGLFSDPNWDLLLDLFAAEQSGQPVSITSAFVAATASPTTASRCLRGLETSGLVFRERDGGDGRRTNVRLTACAITTMTRLLEAMLTREPSQSDKAHSGNSEVKSLVTFQIGI